MQLWLTVAHSNPPGTVSFIRLIVRLFPIVLLLRSIPYPRILAYQLVS